LIQSIKINNFQSLQDIDLELGNFTVITGASSSGKSAITRAIKAVAMNALDSDYITRGSKKASVSLKVDNATVTIERELGDSSVYKIVQTGCEESRFTRLNRQVPAQVTEALGISPGTQEVSSINFAGQFDMPYLLKEGSSSVARVLGELTNVSTIFAAVKEANRRTKNSSAILNIRKKDQAEIVSQLTKYTSLVAKAKDINLAEQIMQECETLQVQVDTLMNLIASLEASYKVLEAFVDLPDIPNLDSVTQAQKNLNDFAALLRSYSASKEILRKSENELQAAQSDIDVYQQKLHSILVEAGTCPTCNQEIH
jgi:DNA repair ATPase RecN